MEVTWNLPKMVDKAYKPLFTAHNRYISYKGSRGSGKSEATARDVIYSIVTQPYVNWLILRRYANTNRQSTFAVIQRAAHAMGMSQYFRFNGSLPEITYMPTGQKIIFRGADKPLSITSVTVEVGSLCRCWVEEAYQFESEEAFDVIDESMRGVIDYPGGYYQTVLTFNPWNENHWLKKRFYDEETQEPDTLAITTTYKNNPFLDKQYVERLKNMLKRNPSRARVAVLGEWGIAEGLVFDNFTVEDFNINETIKRCGHTAFGMDFGFTNDPTTFASLAIDFDHKDIYIYEELYQQGMLTKDILKWLTDHDHMKSDIVADSAEQRLIAELRGLGVRRIRGSVKGAGSIMQGINYLQGFRIHIHPSCTNAIQEFNTYVFDQDKNGKWINKPVDANNHFIDALRYAMEQYAIKQRQLSRGAKHTANVMKNIGAV